MSTATGKARSEAERRSGFSVEAPSQLLRHPDPIRYTLLAAFCLCRQAEITDELIECLIILVHKMGTKAERKVIKELARLTGN